MDPVTLFALANGAVAAVKAGCKLYKDMKGAAGDIKDVLKDLDSQFKKLHPPEKPASPEAKKQYIEERNRIVQLNKQDPTDVYQQIGESLGTYYENYAKCQAIFEEEERHAQEVYTGDASIGKRALQRVIMRKKLEQMGIELRELMVYQSPPELGALYTEVSEMMEKISQEQSIAIAKQMREEQRLRKIRKQQYDRWFINAVIGISAIVVCSFIGLFMAYLVQDRIEKYPHLGTEWIPKSEEKRKKEQEPKIYIGR